MKVLIVDDEPQVREVLKFMLNGEPDLTVVGDANNAEIALGQVVLTGPDVVLMDIRMGETDGIQATKSLIDRGFEGSVLIHSAFDRYLSAAIEVGAAGYVLKGAPRAEILSCIRRCGNGGFVFGSSVMNTPHGFETAIAYLGRHHGTASDTDDGEESGASFQGPDAEDGRSEEIGGEIDVVFSPSVKPTTIFALHKWLLELPGLSVASMDQHWSGDRAFKVRMAIPRTFVSHLLSSPDVSDVIDESPPVQRGAPKDGMTGLPVRHRRFRLALAS